MLSVQKIASDCLGQKELPIRLRRDLFGRLGNFSRALHLREQLQDIRRHHCDFALPPKYIPAHPRMAPISAIHFDHYNSSVTNMPGPTPGEVETKKIFHAGTFVGFPLLGTCLNFLIDKDGNLYGFCGDLLGIGGRVAFNLSLFDDQLEKIDEHEVVQFASWDLLFGDLPLNLGYFVMDDRGRVIVVKDDTDIVFLKKSRANKIEAVRTWPMVDQLRRKVPEETAEQTVAQVLPAYDHGYWIMALGDEDDDDISAYVGKVSNNGRLEDVHIFRGEIIENGMAVDHSGIYIVTDYALYKFSQKTDGRLNKEWRETYDRASEVKPGTEDLSRHGSGSTLTLLGEKDDLVAITDNADVQINLQVFDRQSGQTICKEPLFKPGQSANENTVVGYGNSIIAQNFYDAPDFDEDMWGLKPGLVRYEVKPDSHSCKLVWDNYKFASTATIRLSTRTGLLYATVQTGEDDEYAMAFIDFHTGRIVHREPMPGSGKGYRIGMSPAYFVPGGRLVQPVRRGIVVFNNG